MLKKQTKEKEKRVNSKSFLRQPLPIYSLQLSPTGERKKKKKRNKKQKMFLSIAFSKKRETLFTSHSNITLKKGFFLQKLLNNIKDCEERVTLQVYRS